ncbi:MAG: fluoride efflux transporter CrcB [Gammaproteobacteria bacterium]|nr:MAG: fluoride efflux transporter CrcB [Gammaproteobacteria bacterium]RLA13775.1 MAG: fluoride efflux transporter CrcB [Gammaproteobacteria bacterium]RLA16905.1 MAG: fluoride efflux transporter CrcB [Gammaproteobacteria bacterium]
MINLLAVALGGGAGALSRYGLVMAVTRLGFTGFPWATLIVNVSGSFLIGLVWALLEHKSMLDTPWRALLIVGLLGGFTTFSSFSLETLTMMQQLRWGAAAGNVSLNLVGCLLAVAAGATLANNFTG